MFGKISSVLTIVFICFTVHGANASNYSTVMPLKLHRFGLYALDAPVQEQFKNALNAENCEVVFSILNLTEPFDLKNFWLSRLYQTGICVEQSYDKAIELLKQTNVRDIINSEKLPNMFSDYQSSIHHIRIGLFYENGLGVEKDIELARIYYKSAIYGNFLRIKLKSLPPKYPYASVHLIDFEPSKILTHEYDRYLEISKHAPESYFELAQELEQHPITADAANIWYKLAKEIGHPKAKLLMIKRRLAFEMTYEAQYSFKEAVSDLNELINANYLPALKYTVKLLTHNPLVASDEKTALELQEFIDRKRDIRPKIKIKVSCTGASIYSLYLEDYCANLIIRKN